MTAKLDLRSAKLNIAVEAGKTWEIHLTMPTGWDWTGYSVAWLVRADGVQTPVISTSIGDGITLGTEILDVLVSSTDTALVSIGSYTHEFILTDPAGETPPFIEGAITVS